MLHLHWWRNNKCLKKKLNFIVQLFDVKLFYLKQLSSLNQLAFEQVTERVCSTNPCNWICKISFKNKYFLKKENLVINMQYNIKIAPSSPLPPLPLLIFLQPQIPSQNNLPKKLKNYGCKQIVQLLMFQFEFAIKRNWLNRPERRMQFKFLNLNWESFVHLLP